MHRLERAGASGARGALLLLLGLVPAAGVSQSGQAATARVDAAGHVTMDLERSAALAAEEGGLLPLEKFASKEYRGVEEDPGLHRGGAVPLVRHEDKAQRSLAARAGGQANASSLSLDGSLSGKSEGGVLGLTTQKQASWACKSGPVSNPNEATRTYSSVYQNGSPGDFFARSMLDSDLGWIAGVNRLGEWMQIDLGVVQGVRGVVVQGLTKDQNHTEFVTKYKVTYSLDGTTFTDLKEEFEGSKGVNKIFATFPEPVRARYIRFVVVAWQGRISMRAGVLLCVSCMPGPERNPVELHRIYSSIHSFTRARFGQYRSMLDRPGAWQAARNTVGEWLEIDLGFVQTVRGTVIQGQDCLKNQPQWVTKYTVKFSEDGRDYKDVEEGFEGNNDTRTKVENLFATPVKARFVRFVVLAWHGHISMRAGVLTCQDCWSGPTLDPPEASRVYSSVLDGAEPGTGWARSTHNSSRSWTPKTNTRGENMTLDLGELQEVRGVAVQGDAQQPSWVTLYSVELSEDGKVFNGEGEKFAGERKLVASTFRRAVQARYVRLLPLAWNQHISMRAEVLTCKRCVPSRKSPPESSRHYSSVMGDASSELGGASAWVPQDPQRPGQWMMIDLGEPMYIRGTVVEGWKIPKWWVTMYDVKTSLTGRDFQDQGSFYGPWDEESVDRPFEKMAYVRYVKFVVRSWHGLRIAMKAGVLTCDLPS